MGLIPSTRILSSSFFLLVLTLPFVSGDRTVYSFNNGWKFFLGDIATYECSTPVTAVVFPIDLTNVQITGLNGASGNDPVSCQKSCAMDCKCQAWNYNPSQGCWTGLLQSLGPSNWVTNVTGWVGGGRFGPAEPPSQATNALSPVSPLFYDANWSSVNVPHDFVSYGTAVYSDSVTLQRHGYLPFNNSWYRKTFFIPAEWEGSLIRLHFEGVYRSSDWFMDGNFLLHHESGYTGFDLWLHNATNSSSNIYGYNHTIAGYIDGTTFQEGWYYEGSGITRNVDLIVIDNPVSIRPWGIYVTSSLDSPVYAPDGPWDGSQTANATVYPQTDIANDGPTSVQISIDSAIKDPNGIIIATTTTSQSLSPNTFLRINQQLSLTNALLWFPAPNASSPDRPLYTLVSTVNVTNGNTVTVADTVITIFGIRNVIYDPNNALFINGFPVKITGMSMHLDFGGSGMSVPPNMVAFRVQRLMETGGNGWRTAHNPPMQKLLEETDRRGVLVWEENRFLRAFANFVQDAQDMVLCDRNHPSVIIWSLCNENGCLEDPGMETAISPSVAGAKVAEMYKEAMYEADRTRPITANTHALINEPGTILDALDVLGVTYDYGAYDTLHTAVPWKSVIGGESASCVSDRNFYINDNDTAGIVSSYDPLGCTGPAWQAAATRPWIPGSFQWSGANYYGESEWPAVSSHYGVLDTCGFAKPVYYWYTTWWGGPRTGPGGQPLGDPAQVYGYPAWDGNGYSIGDKLTIIGYVSSYSAGLTVNGQFIGNQTISTFGYAQWNNIVYSPGSYSITAYDSNGNIINTFTSQTPGDVENLQLSLTWKGTGSNGELVTDGIDSVLVTVAAIDGNKQIVGNANIMVDFTLTGPGVIYGLCNGDPLDHMSMKVPSRNLYVGLARITIQSIYSMDTSTNVTLTATANGLPVAQIIIPTTVLPSTMMKSRM